MDPEGPSAFADLGPEMWPEEAKLFARRAAGRDVATRTPADPAAGRAALRALIDRAVTRLEALLEVRREQEVGAGPRGLDGLAFDDSEDGERLRRYQQARERALYRAIGTLSRVRKEWARDPYDDPASPEAPGEDDAPATSPPIADQCPIGAFDETNPFAEPTTPAEGGIPANDPPESCSQAESSTSVRPESPDTPKVADADPTGSLPVGPDPARAEPAERPAAREVASLGDLAPTGAESLAEHQPTGAGSPTTPPLDSRLQADPSRRDDGETNPFSPLLPSIPSGTISQAGQPSPFLVSAGPTPHDDRQDRDDLRSHEAPTRSWRGERSCRR
jgi:hypothetical protein